MLWRVLLVVAVVYFLAVVSTSKAVSEREGKLIVCDIILLFSIMENQWPIILMCISCDDQYQLCSNCS